MTTPLREFRRGAGGVLEARLDRRERAVLAEVVEGVVDLLGVRGADLAPPNGPAADDDGAGDGPRGQDLRLAWPEIAPPQDPALRRLLPDAAADAGLAAELRRLTEQDLRETKTHQVGLLHAALVAPTADLVVAGPDARAVAAALTDVRLVLGERLGLREDRDAERVYRLAVDDEPDAADDEPDAADDDEDATARFLAAVYVVLSELQESLVERLVEDLPPVRGSGAR